MRKAKVIPAAVRVRRLAATAISAYPAAVSLPIGGTSLRELVEHLVGRHWVEELVLEGPPDPALIDVTLELARQAGRGLVVHAEVNQLDLPPALEGERWSRIAGGWRLSVARADSMTLLAKRVVDIAVSAFLLALLSPLMLAVAFAVFVSSPGPIFYSWRVLGSFGRPVASYKFRTMCDGADRMKDQLVDRNEMTGPVFKIADDPRVTRVGRVLRRYSMDELPQLWSVLKGDLSLVGPRPPSREEYANFDLWQMRKLTVKPGITCIWQVSGRNRVCDFCDWVRMDLEYIDRWSLRLDALLLGRTVVAVVKGTGR
jgi:lipopolysaccharide/colanic/teichoic acid biosynthesis glycosyltransferase